MKGKRGWKILLRYNLLSFFLVIGLIILTAVLAGDVIIKEGDVEISDDLNSSGVLYVDSVNDRVGIGNSNPSRTLELRGDGLINLSNSEIFEIINSTNSSLISANGSNGFVGIGTTRPNYKLHIADKTIESSRFAQIGFTNDATGDLATDGTFIGLDSSTSSLFDIWNYETNGDVRIGVANTEVLRVTSDGNVGIGVSSPTSKLEVVGGLNISNSSGAVTLFNNGSSPNIGIGTAIPNWKLHLHTIGGGEGSRIQLSNDDSGSTDIDGFQFILGAANEDGFIWNYENSHIRIGVNSVERVRITNAGNVGVKTTTPGLDLEIKNTTASAVLRIRDSSHTCDIGAGATAITQSCSSDRKLKKNIRNLTEQEKLNSLQKILTLSELIKSYQMLSDNKTYYGFVAQDIELIYPDKVTEKVLLSSPQREMNETEIINTEVIKFVENPIDDVDIILSINELKEENALLKTELCRVNPLYAFC